MISNFDESLGQFAVNTFILTHQYMLVQVSHMACLCLSVRLAPPASLIALVHVFVSMCCLLSKK